MLSLSEIEKIIGDWIVYVTEHELIDKKKDFWLLYDYLEDDFEYEYYRRHCEEAKRILDELDAEKKEVQEIREYFLPIIKKYEKRGFFAI